MDIRETSPRHLEAGRDVFVSRVFRNAAANPKHDALVAGDIRITYGGLAQRVMSLARCWKEEGLQCGDIVVLAAQSTPTFAYSYLAAHLLGVTVVPVDPAAPARRLLDIADRLAPKAIYIPSAVDCGKWDRRPPEALDAASLEYESLTPDDFGPPPGPGDLADIIFTTGTTGAPKGVRLSHANICAAADSINAFVGNTAADREVIPLPLSLSFGLGRLRCVLSLGGTLVLVNGFMFPDVIFEAMAREKATGFCFVPAGLAVLFHLAGDRLGDFAEQLSYIEIGSAPMPLEHKQRLMRLLPETRICMHYGLTEASRSAFIEFHTDRDHLDTVGRPSPGVEFRIMVPTGRPAAIGDTGEICVRGPHVMQGYWQDERETAQAIRNGWLHTGDIGSTDADGYIRLLGRQKELINVGGRKVVPSEVESVLNAHPAIAECACAGIADPEGLSGEAVKAFLVASGDDRPSPKDFARFLKGRLEAYKIPVRYEWVEAIPKTSSGKLQRQALVAER